MIFFKKEINNFSTIALHQDCQYNIYYSKSEGIITIVFDFKKKYNNPLNQREAQIY